MSKENKALKFICIIRFDGKYLATLEDSVKTLKEGMYRGYELISETALKHDYFTYNIEIEQDDGTTVYAQCGHVNTTRL